jgi:hypothetical protein
MTLTQEQEREVLKEGIREAGMDVDVELARIDSIPDDDERAFTAASFQMLAVDAELARRKGGQ